MKVLKKLNLQPKNLVLIFIVVAILIISSALFELFQSRNEMFELMAEQSHSLLETTLASSNNALLSYETIDQELKTRLLNNANLVKMLYEKNQLSNKLLSEIANENKVYRINIFDKNGNKVFTSSTQIHTDLEENFSPVDFLQPIFNDEADTLYLGIKKARYLDEYRFALAVAAKNRSAIVVNVNAEDLIKFRREIGFGSLLKKLTLSDKIVYAALQDYNNILAASGNVKYLEPIDDSEFLSNSLNDSTFLWRIFETDSLNVFEAVHPFSHKNRLIGLFRLGLSLDPLNAINERIIRRIVIIGIILFVLGSLLLVYIFTQQNFDVLQKRFKVVEDYSNQVIQNVSDAVIVLDENKKVKIINSAAQKLFYEESTNADNNLSKIIQKNNCKNLLELSEELEQIECTIKNQKKYLLVSKSSFTSEDNNKNMILVIRDLTSQKLLEEQIQRKERMVAMGELASGVAHEIRNPLNTISTITQQLNKDFAPKENEEEYHTLSSLVANEVKRINQTINSFLRFSKPEQISPTKFQLSDLINQVEKQYKPMLSEKNTNLYIELNWNGEVYWDRNQIQQVIMNLIQNSYDAIENNGKINIVVNENENKITLTISDNGNGIPDHLLNKIFNLYFTTKAKGTGIGLSIVQKIIIEHGGLITVDSGKNIGTIFTITLPKFFHS